MLKFIKHHMETISGIEIYPLLSFVLFFVFFVVMAWYVFGRDNNHWNKMSMLPFGADPDSKSDNADSESQKLR